MTKRSLECGDVLDDGKAPDGSTVEFNTNKASVKRAKVVGTIKKTIHYMLWYSPVMTTSIPGVDSHIMSKSSGYLNAKII